MRVVVGIQSPRLCTQQFITHRKFGVTGLRESAARIGPWKNSIARNNKVIRGGLGIMCRFRELEIRGLISVRGEPKCG